MLPALELHITGHAVQRYQERIADVPEVEVRSRIGRHVEAIRKGAAFGAAVVRLGDGTGFVISGMTVITVLARGMQIGPSQ